MLELVQIVAGVLIMGFVGLVLWLIKYLVRKFTGQQVAPDVLGASGQELRSQFVQSPPAFKVIAADLRAKIVSGELQTGAQLPSASQLRQGYGVSGTVVRDALSELRHDGLIVGQPGKGVFVAEQDPMRNIAYLVKVEDEYLDVVFTDGDIAWTHAEQVGGTVERLALARSVPQRLVRHHRHVQVAPDGRVTTVYADADEVWDYQIIGGFQLTVDAAEVHGYHRVSGCGPDQVAVDVAVRREVTRILDDRQQGDRAHRDVADEITRLGQEMGLPE